MFFRCKNCGGNIVYNPDKGMMVCPHCGGEETQDKKTGEGENYNSLETCLNCGAPIKPGPYTSAEKCEYCGHYLIHDERVTGKYKPSELLPFRISKEKAKEILFNAFKKKVFAPSDFLSNQMLEKMTGMYVPYFLYDMNVNGEFEANATKTRRWISGDTEYTETSIYRIHRKLKARFNRVPVDASDVMPDDSMDLMEPYDYADLKDFREPDLSGFYSECYNKPSDELAYRAETRAKNDTDKIIRNSITGAYTTITPMYENIDIASRSDKYSLLPVWQYIYSYKDKLYTYYINGQTGKLVGEAPRSMGKILGYAATLWALIFVTFMVVMHAV